MGGRGGGGKAKGGRARTQRKHFRQGRENVWKRSKSEPSSDNENVNHEDRHRNWESFATQNSAFVEYYKEQGIVSPEEWDAFMKVLRKPLPAAFRINSSTQFCADIQAQLENDFTSSLQAEIVDGSEVVAIRPLPWYPENLAWQTNFSRMQLRKNQTLERFHEFLKLENEIGNITRQEAVSMVPPLFLDVHPHHFILDMCAAPGSKTFQLLEVIHQSSKAGSLPNGMVVANDLDVQRCNLLIHQTKRMCTANLIVTNHEAQHFPACRVNINCSKNLEVETELKPYVTELVFDRVLCDVPCSGDGTLRKASDIWRRWNVGLGNGLHSLQVQIAMRGASLLKVGGRMIYSTCSMNPVENEAVVAEILRQCGGSLELVDVSSELPQLVRRHGLRKWKVCDKGVWLASYTNVSDSRKSVILPSMFPSGRHYDELTDNNHNTDLEEKKEDIGIENSEAGLQSAENSVSSAGELFKEECKFPLERCMRIMPHDQNSGAFFIAVFHKVFPLPAIREKQNSLQGESDSNNGRPSKLAIHKIGHADNLDVHMKDGMDEKIPDASMIESTNHRPGEALEHNPLITSGEHNTEEALEPANREPDPKQHARKRKLQMQGKWRGVDPVVFFKDGTIINSIKTFYGIDESFPFNCHLVTRNSDTSHVKRIYYLSKSVKDILELNFSVGQQLKITSIGLKMFERQTSREGSSTPCSFRISSEGLPVILPYITKQILSASPADFKHLLQYKSIKFSDFVDAEFGQKASNLMPGCCVVVLAKGSKASSDAIQVDESTVAIGCWKGKASLTVMVTAIDCQELLERLLKRMDFEKSS